MTKRKGIELFFIGFVFSFIAVCMIWVFGVGRFDAALAETITSTSTSWSSETLVCDDDVTIDGNVTVSGNATLSIAFGKTLTINGKLTINNNRTLTISGPGDLVISANDVGTSSGAINLSAKSNLTVNDGRVIVTVTGNSYYGIHIGNASEYTSKITLNDGALIVNGGTKAGIAAHDIVLKRGLLRVRSTGIDDTLTYGILMDSITVGDEDYLSYRPTLDVVEPSTQSYAVSKYPDSFRNGRFSYQCGFVECQAGTDAIYCNQMEEYDSLTYAGTSKSNATEVVDALSGTYPYVAIAHQSWNVIGLATEGDYLLTINSGLKQDAFVAHAVGTVATLEGRVTVNDPLTDFDQFIKDLFCPMAEGAYGIVKDFAVSGGSGMLTATERGFVVSDYFLEQATVTGKYTYFNGVDYTEVPFEIEFTVVTEITSEINFWGAKMICTDDVIINDEIIVTGSAEVYIPAGKTVTINNGMIVCPEKTLTMYGPGNLVINKADETSTYSGVLTIQGDGSLILNDGCITVNATGTTYYGIYAIDEYDLTIKTTITINDGALIVNGGTKTGVMAYDVTIVRGLLRIHSTGTDGTMTYGLKMQNLIIGIENNYAYRPTIEVIEPSTDSCAITNLDVNYSGEFYYYCGFVEAQASTRAIYCHSTWYNMVVEYVGTNAENASLSGSSNSPYIFLTHNYNAVKKDAGVGDYCYSLASGLKSDGLIVHPVGTVATLQGRASPEDPLTDFDQYIKDIFCPMAEGPYGVVKDISVSGGEGNLSAIDRGFVVSDYFLGTATVSGKYTYFNGTGYTEVPFSLDLTVATEITSRTTSFGAKMACSGDVIVDDWVTMKGSADLYVPAGATLTLDSGFRINGGRTLRIFGPGKIVINKEDGIGTHSAAFTLDANATLILEDGYVQVNATGTTKHGVYGGNNSLIRINDGAFVVNGGTNAGIDTYAMEVNQGFLRVHSTGTNDVATYGILITAITIGTFGDYTRRPTVEVIEPSTDSYGIANHEIDVSDPNKFFRFNCGFVEIEASTQALQSNNRYFTDDIITYHGNTKADSVKGSVSDWDIVPYVFILHNDSKLYHETDDYLIALNFGRKEAGVYVTPTSTTVSFEGRESENGLMRAFDQIVKDFFYPIVNGIYGTVTDLTVTDGNGHVVATSTGFVINGKFNGDVTLSGTYTYFDGEEYQEELFEIGIVVSGGPDMTYEANENVLTATYGTFGSYDVSLVAPTALAYNDSAKVATFAAGYDTSIFPNAQIKYYKGGQEVASCVDAGDYRATVTFGDTTAEVLFTITKADLAELSVSLAGWGYGTTENTPSVSGNVSNGEATILYKVKDSDDSTYSETVPTTAGEYTVKVSVAESANYNAAFAVTNFTVAPKVATLVWSNTEFTYNGSAQVPTATIRNLEDDDEVTVIVEGARTEAGTYTATATSFSGRSAANYALPAEATCEFSIAQAPVIPSDNEPTDPEVNNNEESIGDAALPQEEKHGFCLGWIALVAAMFELVCCALILLLKIRKSVRFLVGIGVGAAATAFSVVVICLHICPISIASVVLAPFIAGAFAVVCLALGQKDEGKGENEQ